MRVGPCTPVGMQLYKAGVGPTSGPTWRLFHLGHQGPRRRPGALGGGAIVPEIRQVAGEAWPRASPSLRDYIHLNVLYISCVRIVNNAYQTLMNIVSLTKRSCASLSTLSGDSYLMTCSHAASRALAGRGGLPLLARQREGQVGAAPAAIKATISTARIGGGRVRLVALREEDAVLQVGVVLPEGDRAYAQTRARCHWPPRSVAPDRDSPV